MSRLFFDAYTCFGPRQKAHGQHPWTFNQLVDELHHCSISGALVASTAQTVYDPALENRRLSEKLAPHDHLFAIWRAMPHWTGEFPEPEVFLAECQAADIRAVSLQPKTQGFPLSSAYTRPLLQALEAARVLTILDIDETSYLELEQVLDLVPELPLLLRGPGWSSQREVFPLLLHHPNLHLSFERFQVNLGLEHLVELGCESQLVFSSNAPEMSAGAHRAYIDWADLPEATKDAIAGGNLSRLLKGLKPPRLVENADEDELMAATRAGQPLPCLTLDMHAHILDEGLNGAGGRYGMYDGGPSGVVRLAKRMGVDGIGVMSWNGTVGAHAAEGNACVKAAVEAYPDFFWGLATFDPAHDSAATMRRQMEEIFADPRFLGLKPYPMYGLPYDDSRYDVWWEFGNERGLYTGVHQVKWGRPDEIDSICSRFPDLTVLIYHCGASYEFADMAIDCAQRWPNVMLEPTLTPVCGGIIDYLVAGAGADRVMYGSDLPMRDPRQQLGWIVFSRLSLEVKKQVLGQNANRLLSRIRSHAAK